MVLGKVFDDAGGRRRRRRWWTRTTSRASFRKGLAGRDTHSLQKGHRRMNPLLLLAVPVGLAGLVVVNMARVNAAFRQMAKALWDAATPVGEGAYRPEQLEGLPAPVSRYLSAVLRPGTPLVRRVRMRQRGEMHQRPDAPRWQPFTAVQHITTSPPGFVWDATFSVGPVPLIRVVDRYQEGRGELHVRLAGTFPVVDSSGRSEMDEGELMRYLAETPWYPTALLPGQGVEWSAIDERSARATLRHGGTEVSLVFLFDDQGLVTEVRSEHRWKEEQGRFVARPWGGRFFDYREAGGMRIPMRGEVFWLLPEGEFVYWRGRIESIEVDR